MSWVLELSKTYFGVFASGFLHCFVLYTSACLPDLARAKQP